MRKREEGAAIVEAAVIVPMIWIIMMGSIFLCFFFLDMGVIRSETMHVANETAAEWRNPDHVSVTEKRGSLRTRINRRLILAQLESEHISVSSGTVTVKASIRFLFHGKGLTFTNCSKAAIDNREKWIRALSVLSESEKP